MTTKKFQNFSEKLKILFITNSISPYMDAFFNTLSKYSKEVDFNVVACSYIEPDREWSLDFLKSANYKFEILKDAKLFKTTKKNRFFYLGGFSLIKEISKYDVIIFKGGARFIGPFYAFLAKLLGIKTVLWEENGFETTETFMKLLIRAMYVNKNLFSSFIVYGTHVKELIEKFNKDVSDKIFFSCSPVKNEKFRDRYIKLLQKKALMRKKLEISPEKKVVLFVGRFVDEKNLFTLIDSIERIVNNGEKNVLCLLVGGGYLEKSIINQIKDKKLENFIKIVPFMQFKKLSMFYTISDIFVLPSKWEPWGLVINEAMNFDLPVIVSDKVGCALDLIKNGVNGYIFPFEDSEKLSECILNVAKDSVKLGENSYKIIKNANFDNLCIAVINAALKSHDMDAITG